MPKWVVTLSRNTQTSSVRQGVGNRLRGHHLDMAIAVRALLQGCATGGINEVVGVRSGQVDDAPELALAEPALRLLDHQP